MSSDVEVLRWLKKIESKYMRDEGIILGAKNQTTGEKTHLVCTSEGHLKVSVPLLENALGTIGTDVIRVQSV